MLKVSSDWNSMMELGISDARMLPTATIQERVREMRATRASSKNESEQLGCTAYIEGVNSVNMKIVPAHC